MNIGHIFPNNTANLEGEAEADAIATIRGGVAETKRDATVSREAEPTTATVHAVGPAIGTCGIALDGAAIISIPIDAPFIHIAAHIVDA